MTATHDDRTKANAAARAAYPMSCRAYDLYWSAQTPREEDIARLLIAVTRRLEDRGDVDPIDGTPLPSTPKTRRRLFR